VHLFFFIFTYIFLDYIFLKFKTAMLIELETTTFQ
jgi:hypothetical protein